MGSPVPKRVSKERYARLMALQQEVCHQRLARWIGRTVEVLVKGPGSGRETAIRSIQNTGIEVSGIKDVTPVPHNGCRPSKRRRV